MNRSIYAHVADALEGQGLLARGGFEFGPGDTPPTAGSGKPARSIILVGNAGSRYWSYFQRWLAGQGEVPDNPLDRWSAEVIGGVARQFGARAVSPSDRPWLPFHTWAMRAEGIKPSPLGMLIHPTYGLWHAWRGALLFDDEIDLPRLSGAAHPCDCCAEKPCLTACPVGAFNGNGFDADACARHVKGPDGTTCSEAGCLARNACPVGEDFRQPAEVQAFHLHAFLVGREAT